MTKDKLSHPTFDHDLYARTCSPDDFWGQIRRTVNGEPVSEDQIQLIVDMIRTKLFLHSSDILLDLACGNGALTKLLFNHCAESLGVDLSEYLISIANKYFAKPPQHVFEVHSATDYLKQEKRPERFTKALCYGSFSYLSSNDAQETLALLSEKYINIQTVFIGNLPDLEESDKFYRKRKPSLNELTDHHSQIGIWRSKNAFIKLAHSTGWEAHISNMPENFYAAYYRYDITLTRPNQGNKTGTQE